MRIRGFVKEAGAKEVEATFVTVPDNFAAPLGPRGSLFRSPVDDVAVVPLMKWNCFTAHRCFSLKLFKFSLPCSNIQEIVRSVSAPGARRSSTESTSTCEAQE